MHAVHAIVKVFAYMYMYIYIYIYIHMGMYIILKLFAVNFSCTADLGKTARTKTTVVVNLISHKQLCRNS